jgi:hypothetical protein
VFVLFGGSGWAASISIKGFFLSPPLRHNDDFLDNKKKERSGGHF